MGLSEDSEQENTEERFRGLCADLNIDKNTGDEAWRNYETISTNYTLEVNIPCESIDKCSSNEDLDPMCHTSLY